MFVTDTPCTVQSSTATEVQCKLSLQADVEPGVILPAAMRVDNLGIAVIAITGEWNKGFTIVPEVSALSHSAGSLGGGQLLTITGMLARTSIL